VRCDEDGFLWIVDRKKDIIITGGENVFPVEVEDFIHTNPNVKDAAVIGLPDERLGEIVAAIIEMIPGKTVREEEMFKFLESLPRYKRPRKIFFGDIPRNPTGKMKSRNLGKICRQGGSIQNLATLPAGTELERLGSRGK